MEIIKLKENKIKTRIMLLGRMIFILQTKNDVFFQNFPIFQDFNLNEARVSIVGLS